MLGEVLEAAWGESLLWWLQAMFGRGAEEMQKRGRLPHQKGWSPGLVVMHSSRSGSLGGGDGWEVSVRYSWLERMHVTLVT